MTPESLAEAEVEIVVTFTGLDETISQTIHARHSYIAEEIIWNHRFVLYLEVKRDGELSIIAAFMM